MSRRMLLRALLGAMVAIAEHSANAQPTVDVTRDIDFDRPEAWAMARSASLTLLTALGPPRARAAGDFEFALELSSNPSLSEDERRVGFNGTKVEDLNRLAVIPRPRLAVGLGRGLSLEVAYTPPVEVNGIRPNLLALALDRPLWSTERWALGARAYGQIGTVEGDITCTEDEAQLPPGEAGNPFGCGEPSSDQVTLDHAGIAVTGGYWFAGNGHAALHFALNATYMDLDFQVDALTYGVRDRTLLRTDGWAYSVAGGCSLELGAPTRLAIEAFYGPLDVVRPVYDEAGSLIGAESENDALLNLRAMLSYRF